MPVSKIEAIGVIRNICYNSNLIDVKFAEFNDKLSISVHT